MIKAHQVPASEQMEVKMFLVVESNTPCFSPDAPWQLLMVNQCHGCVRDSLKAGVQRWAGFPFANLQMCGALQGTKA